VLLLGSGTFVHVASGGDISTTSVVLPIAGITSLSVGIVLVTRLPRHGVAWLLWSIGMLTAITVITQGLADLGLSSHPGSVPGAVWFAWVAAWAGELALFVPAIVLPLLYPTGSPPSPRWRPVEFAAIVAILAWAVSAAFGPFPGGTYPPGVKNPLALGGTAGDVLAQIPTVLDPVLFVLLVLALASLFLRYRRAEGIERQQIRWFAYVGAIAIGALLVAGGASGITGGLGATIDSVAWLTGIGAVALMPIAIGIAVLRYRLFEIDRLISRTLAYGLVTVVLVAVFGGAILALQALLSPLTGGNTLAVAGSTLLVATLFQPLGRRVQRVVDRRFNRARYDAQAAVSAFAARLRDEVDLDTLQGSLLTLVEATLEPTTASLWLRES
jgi:uncharacterized membrane protein SirB2